MVSPIVSSPRNHTLDNPAVEGHFLPTLRSRGDPMARRRDVSTRLTRRNFLALAAAGDEVQRAKILMINAGANSDEIRSKRCHRYVFSTEGCNTQYVSAIGNWLIRERKISRWYFLTSDYAFGHDLLRVARNLLMANKGTEVGSDLAPTGTTDFSQYITKIKAAKPDLVFHNL